MITPNAPFAAKTLIPIIPIAIPVDPIISKGFRPNLSTYNIAMIVKITFTKPMTTVCIMDVLLPEPKFSKIRGA